MQSSAFFFEANIILDISLREACKSKFKSLQCPFLIALFLFEQGTVLTWKQLFSAVRKRPLKCSFSLRETYNSIRSSLITQGLADGPLFSLGGENA